jgi:hypothetical protein
MFAEVRHVCEVADHRNNGKDQREEKDEPRWCAQVRHVDPLLDKVPDHDAYGDQDHRECEQLVWSTHAQSPKVSAFASRL